MYTFKLFVNKQEEATMIADGSILFLVYSYGDLVIHFFDQEAICEKSEWTWDAVKSTISNPLSRDLDELEVADDDYDF